MILGSVFYGAFGNMEQKWAYYSSGKEVENFNDIIMWFQSDIWAKVYQQLHAGPTEVYYP